MGATDTGKTTLCRYLLSRTSAHVRTGCVDCDTGQSWIGPPTTEGMTIHPGPSKPVLRFVGSTSPRGHLVQTLTGAKRLAEWALEDGARITLIDSPGLVHGRVGIEFQIQMIDLLRPERIIALQRGRELEGVLTNLARHPTIQTHRFPVSPAVAPPDGSRTAALPRRAVHRLFCRRAGAGDRAPRAGVAGEGARSGEPIGGCRTAGLPQRPGELCHSPRDRQGVRPKRAHSYSLRPAIRPDRRRIRSVRFSLP